MFSAVQNYVIMALVVALALTGYMFKQEREAHIQTEKSLAVVAEVNKANAEALEQMKQLQAQQEKAFTEFANSSKAIDKLRRTVNTATTKLVADNEIFRSWFTLAVNADAIRLYNETRNNNRDPVDREQTTRDPVAGHPPSGGPAGERE